MCPGRNNADQVVIATCVGIDVGLHIDAAPACGLDQLDDFGHTPPELLIGDLQVDDVYRDAGLLTNLDGFADGLEDAGSFVANVSGIDSVVAGDDFTELNNILRGCQ